MKARIHCQIQAMIKQAIALGMRLSDADSSPTTLLPLLPHAGVTVEMHGSVRQLVCPACGHVVGLTPAAARTLKARKPLACGACGHAPIRLRVMLYDDAEGATHKLATALPSSGLLPR